MPIGGYLEWDLQTNLLKKKNKDQDKKIKKRFVLTYGVVLWGIPILVVNTLSANYLGNSELVIGIQLFIDSLLFFLKLPDHQFLLGINKFICGL